MPAAVVPREAIVSVDPLAAYAAVVSSASVGWQVYTWRHGRRTAVLVDVQHSIEPGLRVLKTEDYDQPGETEERWEYELTVVATNRGEVAQYVDQLGLQLLDDRRTFDYIEPNDKALPAAKSIRHSWRVEALAFDLSPGFVGFAVLGTGEVVKSAPQQLDRSLIQLRDS
ncbi:MAG: hypothetical protein ACJ766_09460 [Thermoleophilaceae bacterium]